MSEERSVKTVVSLLSYRLSQDDVRHLIVSLVSEILGNCEPYEAVSRACLLNDITMFRMVSIMIYGTDPLSGIRAKIESCNALTEREVIEVRLRSGSTEYCIAYTTRKPYVVVACRTSQQAVPKQPVEVAVRVA